MMLSKKDYIMKSDVREKKDSYVIEIDLPGFHKEDIQIYLRKAFLVVSASLDEETVTEKRLGKYLHRERYTGTYKREFYVGYSVQEDDIKATYRHGGLKITIPKNTREGENSKDSIVIA